MKPISVQDLQVVHEFNQKLLTYDTVFQGNLIDALLNSYNKESLIYCFNECVNKLLDTCKNTKEYDIDKAYCASYIQRNPRNFLSVILYGYYGDDWHYYVDRTKDYLPRKLNIDELKDCIRIVLSCIYDLNYFEYYAIFHSVLTDEYSVYKRYLKKYIKSRNKGIIVSPRYRTKLVGNKIKFFLKNLS